MPRLIRSGESANHKVIKDEEILELYKKKNVPLRLVGQLSALFHPRKGKGSADHTFYSIAISHSQKFQGLDIKICAVFDLCQWHV